MGRKFNNGRDSSFISQFGNLHFLLLTQMKIAHIFHSVPEPEISLNVLDILEHCAPQTQSKLGRAGGFRS